MNKGNPSPLPVAISILVAFGLSACANNPPLTQPPVPSAGQQVTVSVDSIADPVAVDGTVPSTVPGPTMIVPSVSQCDIGAAISWMEKQKILYTQNPSDEWRDCSGNFLRLSSRIATICPTAIVAAPPGIKKFVVGGNNKRPARARARTTRGLAQWYEAKGAFEPVFYDNMPIDGVPLSLAAVRNRIKPGSVLWFSAKKPLSSHGKSGLYKEPGGMINHMATVVSVTRDDDGNVTGWDMYHGQNSRKHNGVTSHLWVPNKPGKYPPGGYWEQRIAGFAESIIVKPPVVPALSALVN